jgi:mutator protein MutT
MNKKSFGLAVKAVIIDEQNRCLLLRRSAANRNFAGCWEWPGGKVEAGEDFTTALLRETREETSLTIEITALAGTTEFEIANKKIVLLCMEARPDAGEIRLSREHDAFDWVALEELSGFKLPNPFSDFMIKYAEIKGVCK